MDTRLDRETHGLRAEEEIPLEDRLRAAGIRLATRSTDRPRRAAKLRPRWLAFLLGLVHRPV